MVEAHIIIALAKLRHLAELFGFSFSNVMSALDESTTRVFTWTGTV